MYSKLVIKQIVDSQRERLNSMDLGLLRSISGYEKLTSHAFIVTGVRRCGKSTQLQQINRSIGESSIYINFEDPRLAGFDLGDFNRLHEIAIENKINIYFFDEIQLIDKWESFVRFRLDEGYRIFISGSNATMLSRELGTKLTGRHISKELFPFSYQEYLLFTSQAYGEDSALKYLNKGGFPEYIKTDHAEILMQSFNDILFRDIALRHNVKNTSLLQQLAIWLISNATKPFTGNSLKKLFQIGSSSSIMEYLYYFTDAYLFYYVPKFSYSRKVQSVNPKKVYCVDNGFIRINSISFSDDKGRMLENMVFLHLRRQTREIYYFADKRECDFIVFNQKKLKGIYQACWQLDQDNTERETQGLLEAMNYFQVDQGLILTMNQSDKFTVSNKTIYVQPFYEWSKQL